MDDAEARQLVEDIAAAGSPEEAARIGRGAQRGRSHLVRPDWDAAKLGVMYTGLQAKVRCSPPRSIAMWEIEIEEMYMG